MGENERFPPFLYKLPLLLTPSKPKKFRASPYIPVTAT